MRNYASKCNRRVTRYRTSSTFKARQIESVKRLKFSLPTTPAPKKLLAGNK
ncbi:MAG: hypothetical protein HY973_01675 [Candidatus Kerfeldbacteria bacterium]|nr:hypothetical protein [Candidatus Kerfeldbacteria bacterium]